MIFCLLFFVFIYHGNSLERFFPSININININKQNGFLKSEEAQIQIPSFQWEKQWYPVAVEAYTDKTKSQKFSLLGNDVVLWYDGYYWRLFEDRCPHRGVPLSEGRVEKTNELLCAYHAWKFDGEGKCTSIPQTKSIEKEKVLKNTTSSCIQSYPTQVRQGLIWAWGEKGLPNSNIHLNCHLKNPQVIEELFEPQFKGRIPPVKWNFRDLPYGWDMFMENTLDVAHVPVAHHGIVGNRYKDAKPIKFYKIPSKTEIPDSEGEGEGEPFYPEDAGFQYVQKNDSELSTSEPAFSSDFRPPCLNKITTNIPGGAKLILALYATPTRPGYCRYFGFQTLIAPETKNGTKALGLGFYGIPMPTWLLHILSSIFLHQDQVFLHHQERILYATSNYAFGHFDSKYNLTNSHKAYSSHYFMPNEHDQPITMFRKWISDKAGGGPRWGAASQQNGLPSRLEDSVLFDVYHSHTKNCLVCQKALRNIQLFQKITLLPGLTILILLWTTKLYTTFWYTLLFSCITLGLNKLIELFYTYRYSHQDNH